MDFFETLVIGAQAYQSYKLNQIDDGIAELNARQEQQIANQERLQIIINEVDEFQQRLIECSAEFDSKPGHAVYWAFRFLRWCEFESVCRRSLPDLANKDHFSRTVQMTREMFDYGQKFYSKDEIFSIKRLVYLDCGYLDALHELICWRKIYAEMKGKWYFYKPTRAEEVVGVILCTILGIFTLFIGLFVIVGGILWMKSLARKKLRELAPLATECGGILTEAATRQDVVRILNETTQKAVHQRINVHLPTSQLETLCRTLKAEYEQSCACYLAEKSLGSNPDLLPPGSQN
jgi:hypothetical protein